MDSNCRSGTMQKQKIDQEIHTWIESGRKTPSTIGSKGMPPVVTRFCCTTRSSTSAACIQSWSSAVSVWVQPSNSPSFVDLNEWEVVFDKSRRSTEQIWCLTVTVRSSPSSGQLQCRYWRNGLLTPQTQHNSHFQLAAVAQLFVNVLCFVRSSWFELGS